MLVVNVGAFKLARQGWPGGGVKLPWGPTIPIMGFVAAIVQLPSLGWQSCLLGGILTFGGYLMFAFRHQTWLAGDITDLERRVRELETPLGRALRHAESSVLVRWL